VTVTQSLFLVEKATAILQISRSEVSIKCPSRVLRKREGVAASQRATPFPEEKKKSPQKSEGTPWTTLASALLCLLNSPPLDALSAQRPAS